MVQKIYGVRLAAREKGKRGKDCRRDDGLGDLVPRVLDQLPWRAGGVLLPHPLVGHGESFLGRHGFSRWD